MPLRGKMILAAFLSIPVVAVFSVTFVASFWVFALIYALCRGNVEHYIPINR